MASELVKWKMEEIKRTGGGCGICGVVSELVADHNHATGKVRGMVCRSCNGKLTKSFEDVEWLKAALAYCQRETSLDYQPETGIGWRTISIPASLYLHLESIAKSRGISISLLVRITLEKFLQ